MPLLRLSWNKQDPNYIATFQMNSSNVIILDIRVPAVPVSELQCHKGNINSITWSPQSRKHLCSAGKHNIYYKYTKLKLFLYCNFIFLILNNK